MLRHQPTPRRRHATVTIEFALMFFLLVLFMFAIFEYGRFIMLRHLVNNAARAGARQAAINCSFTQIPGTSPPQYQALVPPLNTANIQQTVIDLLANQPLKNAAGTPLQPSDVQVQLLDPKTETVIPGSVFSTATFGGGVAVSVSAGYDPILPGLGFLLPSTPIQVVCIMRSEGN
jgi:hypothetical protein